MSRGRALVLGAGGFIGSHLVKRLIRDGWNVVGVIRDPRASYVQERLGEALPEIRVVTADATDQSVLNRLVPEADVIFPFAGASGAATSVQQPIRYAEENVIGHLRLLEAARIYNPAARIVFPGSRLQYGRPVQLPVPESHPQSPTSLYGLEKATADGYYRLYHEIHGIPTTRLRISNPFGPLQDRPDRAFGLVGTFLALARNDETITLYGGGEQCRDYLYVDDLVELVIACAAKPAAIGEVFNAGGGKPNSIRAMAEAVVDVVGGGRTAVVPWPDLDRAIETGDYLASIEKARELLDWTPATDLHEGLLKTTATPAPNRTRL